MKTQSAPICSETPCLKRIAKKRELLFLAICSCAFQLLRFSAYPQYLQLSRPHTIWSVRVIIPVAWIFPQLCKAPRTYNSYVEYVIPPPPPAAGPSPKKTHVIIMVLAHVMVLACVMVLVCVVVLSCVMALARVMELSHVMALARVMVLARVMALAYDGWGRRSHSLSAKDEVKQ